MKIGKDACSVSRVPAGEVEAAVIAQVRKVLQAPEVMSQAIREVAALDPTADAQDTILTLRSIEPLWDELVPAERGSGCSSGSLPTISGCPLGPADRYRNQAGSEQEHQGGLPVIAIRGSRVC
jgi:hypothetical protein